MERLIGTVRRECLDLVLVFGEAHLRQILSSYAAYYNEIRTHFALGKDAPLGRAVQRTGVHCSHPLIMRDCGSPKAWFRCGSSRTSQSHFMVSRLIGNLALNGS